MITSVEEIWTGRDGEFDAKSRRYTRVFRVFTDDPFDEARTVAAALPVAPGDSYPLDAFAWAEQAQVRQDSTRLVWLATVRYSSERERQPNPLDDPAEIEWDGDPFQRPLVKDKDGKAVLNSAGDPFDPPIMRDDNRPVVVVTKNVAAVPAYVLTYRDVTNSDQFSVDGITVEVGYAKIRWIKISPWNERNNVRYRTLTIPIHINTEGWKFFPLQQGFRQRVAIADAGQVKQVPCWDKHGKQVTSPALLDEDGAQIVDPTPDSAKFGEFEGYGALPFSALPLS